MNLMSTLSVVVASLKTAVHADKKVTWDLIFDRILREQI